MDAKTGTYLYSGIREAYDRGRAAPDLSSRRIIVLITDGGVAGDCLSCDDLKNYLDVDKLPVYTFESVRTLVREHMSRYPKLRQGSIKKLINRLGKDNVDDFINLQLADIIGSKPPFDFDTVIDLKREIKRVLEAEEPLSVKDLAINGDDLIDIGIQPGRRMGEILHELLQIVLESPELNTKNHLLDVVRQMPLKGKCLESFT